jgi:hypothetical protein
MHSHEDGEPNGEGEGFDARTPTSSPPPGSRQRLASKVLPGLECLLWPGQPGAVREIRSVLTADRNAWRHQHGWHEPNVELLPFKP